MKNVAMIVIPLFMMVIAGFQAARPEKLIRYNNRHTLWQPKWAERMSTHPLNIASARVAGILVFVFATVMLVNGIATLFGSGFLPVK